MKKVRDLDAKKKYRNDLWLDRYGDVWFWSALFSAWCTLNPVTDYTDGELRGIYSGRRFKHGYFLVESEDLGDDTPWPDAPFRRIRKGSRK